MSRRLRADDPIEDFDISFNPALSATKLPTDITGGMSQLTEFMEIPCDRIIEFREKNASDFTAWPEERFQMLVDSIRVNGVLEPVTVRPVEGGEVLFEMLAGEHRWKASMACGRTTIPARVVRACSDAQALEIFSITNLLRREIGLRDKVNGWWHFVQATRHKRKAGLDQLVEEGVISKSILAEAEGKMRQIYRYAKMHDLIEGLLEAADRKQISMVMGEQLAYLPRSCQEDLLEFVPYLNDKNKVAELRQLEKDGQWSKEAIENIFLAKEQPRSPSFREVEKKVGVVIRARLPKSIYDQAADIVEAALEAYLEDHPDLLG